MAITIRPALRKNPQDKAAAAKYYAQVVLAPEMKQKHIVEQIADRCTLTGSDIKAVLDALMVVIKRNLAKINYRIHTDAIKENLIPPELSARQISLVYANEADVLNMALFGMTAKQWRDSHPDLKGNIRDYANVSQLVCLSNLENLNAVFINEGISQSERLAKLNAIAISQMKVLTEDHRLLQLESADDTEKPQ